MMNDMDYKALILDKLSEAVSVEDNNDLSFGELLYSIFRKKYLKTRPFDGSESTKWLLEVKDKDIFSAIDNFIKDK